MTRAVVLVFLLSFVASSLAATSLCDKYAAILGVSGGTLVGVVVNGTVTSVVGNSNTARYFDGSLAPYQDPYAINYTSPSQSAALNHLKFNLDTFFFAALGCTDRSLGNYTGGTMKAVHAPLPIGPTQFESFNRQLLAVLGGAGVTSDDQLAVLGVLNSLKGDICNQPACNNGVPPPVTFCDRYSSALNTTEYDLMDTVVYGVIVNVTAPTSPLKKYFDGTIPGTTNFLAPASAGLLAGLRAHLDQFFGNASVLACTAANFPAYGGKSMIDAHKFLQIDVTAFNMFNQVVLDVMGKAGVTTTDLASVKAVLQSTQSAVVTVSNTTTTTTTGGKVSTTGGGSTSTTNDAIRSAVMTFTTFAFVLVTLVV